jgi:hypothetical protein
MVSITISPHSDGELGTYVESAVPRLSTVSRLMISMGTNKGLTFYESTCRGQMDMTVFVCVRSFFSSLRTVLPTRLTLAGAE